MQLILIPITVAATIVTCAASHQALTSHQPALDKESQVALVVPSEGPQTGTNPAAHVPASHHVDENVGGVGAAVCILGAALVFAVALHTLRRVNIGNPVLIAICAAGLTFLALASQPAGVIGFILLPYAALGLTLLLLWALLLLARLWSSLRHDRRRHKAFQDPIQQFLNWLNNHKRTD